MTKRDGPRARSVIQTHLNFCNGELGALTQLIESTNYFEFREWRWDLEATIRELEIELAKAIELEPTPVEMSTNGTSPARNGDPNERPMFVEVGAQAYKLIAERLPWISAGEPIDTGSILVVRRDNCEWIGDHEWRAIGKDGQVIRRGEITP